MTVQDDREARFLASQSARIAACAAAASSGGKKNEEDTDASSSDQARIRSKFWSAFRERCSGLHGEIEAMLSPSSCSRKHAEGECDEDDGNVEKVGEDTVNVERYYATASARARASAKLDTILRSIRSLEHSCLDHSSGGSTVPVPVRFADNDDNDQQPSLPPLPDVLPPGDVRLLSEELSKLKKRVDEVRDVICPPELFVFRRYRALMAAREGTAKPQEFGGSDEANAPLLSNNGGDNTGKDKRDEEEDGTLYGASIQNKSGCIIAIQRDGSISEAQDGNTAALEERIAERSVLGTASAAVDASSILIKDMDHCRITMYANSIPCSRNVL